MKKVIKSFSHLILASSVFVAVTVKTSFAQTVGDKLQGSAIIPTTDTGFISKNIMDNIMEIQLSTLAQKNGQSPAVKKLSATMLKDHTMILNELKAAAHKKSMTLPEGASDMSNMGMTSPVPDMTGLTGVAFDHAWIRQMLLMHNNKVTELKATINGTNFGSDVKALARTALAKVQIHQKVLEALSIPNQ